MWSKDPGMTKVLFDTYAVGIVLIFPKQIVWGTKQS